MQSKPSGSHILLQSSSQPCNLAKSNIPNFHKTGTLNPIQQKPPRSSVHLLATPSTVQTLAFIKNAASTEKIKFNSELNIKQKVTLQMQHNSKTYDKINHNHQLHNICEYVAQQPMDYAAACKFKNGN